MDEFADALWDAGYAKITAHRHIRAAQHLIHWAQYHQVPLAKMDDAQVERFKRHLPRCRCPSYGCYDRHGLVRGAHVFLGHLRRINAIPPPADNGQKSETSPLLDAFRQWMRVNRNIGQACLYDYSLAVRDLLHAMGDDLLFSKRFVTLAL